MRGCRGPVGTHRLCLHDAVTDLPVDAEEER
jgi:hypothetical protein